MKINKQELWDWLASPQQYKTISHDVWEDTTFLSLPSWGRFLWLAILTNPDLSLIGLLGYTIDGLSRQTGLAKNIVSRGLSRLEEVGLIERDAKHPVLWAVRYIRYNAIDSPNLINTVSRRLKEKVANCEVRERAVEAFIYQIVTRPSTKSQASWPTAFLQRWGHRIGEKHLALFDPELVARHRVNGDLATGFNWKGDLMEAAQVWGVDGEADPGARPNTLHESHQGRVSRPNTSSFTHSHSVSISSKGGRKAEPKKDGWDGNEEGRKSDADESLGDSSQPREYSQIHERLLRPAQDGEPALYSQAGFDAACRSLDVVRDRDAGGDASLILDVFIWALDENPSPWYRDQVKLKANPIAWMTSGKVWEDLLARYNLAHPEDEGEAEVTLQ